MTAVQACHRDRLEFMRQEAELWVELAEGGDSWKCDKDKSGSIVRWRTVIANLGIESAYDNFSTRSGRYAIYMRNSLADRTISSRSQADAWVRKMSMQISHGTTKPYWLRDSGVELHDSDCKRIENQYLHR